MPLTAPQEIQPGVWLQEVAQTTQTLQGRLRLRRDCPFFAGHFPQRPVFPAVGQLALLSALLQGAYGPTLAVVGLPRAKFLSPVAPESQLEFALERDPQRPGGSSQEVRWRLSGAEGPVAQGVLVVNGWPDLG